MKEHTTHYVCYGIYKIIPPSKLECCECVNHPCNHGQVKDAMKHHPHYPVIGGGPACVYCGEQNYETEYCRIPIRK